MKTAQYLPLALIITLFGLLTAADPATADRGSNRWTSLGELHVKDRVERDTLRVGVKTGTFDSIRLKVKGRAVQFHRVEIHFKNDTVQEVSLRSVIRAGRFSRVIDLEGGQRVIEKIAFVYDAQTRGRGKTARIQVFGNR